MPSRAFEVHISFQGTSSLQDSLQLLATVSFTLHHDAYSTLVSTGWLLEPSQFYQKNRIPLASNHCPRTSQKPRQDFLRTAPYGLFQRSDLHQVWRHTKPLAPFSCIHSRCTPNPNTNFLSYPAPHTQACLTPNLLSLLQSFHYWLHITPNYSSLHEEKERATLTEEQVEWLLLNCSPVKVNASRTNLWTSFSMNTRHCAGYGGHR